MYKITINGIAANLNMNNNITQLIKKIIRMIFSLFFQILEFSLKEQLLRKTNIIKVKINLFTQVSIQSFLCL